MKTNKLMKFFSFAMIAGIVLISSCVDEERITLQDTQDITEEALTDSYFQDMDDMAGVAIETPTDNQYSGGRTATTITIQDDRFKCNGVVVTITPDANSTVDVPKGVMVADFGTGCTDLRGNVRTGKLIFTYSGRRFLPGSKLITTTDNYTINEIKLEGTRTLTNVQTSSTSAPRFNVVLSGGKATFTDGTVATRESNITYEWVRAANPASDQLVVDQSSTASGKTRAGRSYALTLLKSLKYQRFCGIAVEGIKKYVIDGGKEITIDYGDGTCDKSVTITVSGGTSRTINVGG
ncbi:MAG: hypothetical protein ACOYXT_24085 [Bacteroidota bacterium]